VTDLAEALIAAALAPATAGNIYHAAHPDVVTQRVMVEGIGRAMGKRVRMVPLSATLTRSVLHFMGAAASLARVDTLFTADKANEFLAPAWTCVAERLEQDAGWKARIDHEQGFAETARWYRERGWL
jgi:nucleoside-diphosphate-sugar epimerase